MQPRRINMRADAQQPLSWPRRLALAAVTALGLVAIVGSGGGSSAPECSFFSNVCNPVVNPPPAQAGASVAPLTLTVQAGVTALFTAQTVNVAVPRYQWRRSTDGGLRYTDIVGATGDSFALANTQLADDGALFRVDVHDGQNTAVVAISGASALLVSPLPGVVFQDAEFLTADWSVTAIADPLQNGPTHSEQRDTVGGFPGAFRHMAHGMSAGPSHLRVFNLRPAAIYDPAVQGAIHAIDYSEDCSRLSANFSSLQVTSYLLFEQGGRRYVSNIARGCVAQWIRPLPGPSLRAANFVFVDGPACAANEACPNFAASAPPMRFGFERRVDWPAGGAAAASIEHGIDNWQVTVWRK